MPTDRTDVSPKHQARLLLITLVVLAAGIRLLNMPALHELRDCDEIVYTSSGLVALEGMVPTTKASPAGPQTWIQCIYGAVNFAREVIHPSTGGGVPLSWKIRPFVAMDNALFAIYSDISPLCRTMVLISIVLASLATYCAFQFGRLRGGLAGGSLLGGMMAFLPVFVWYSASPRCYCDAWSFAFMAIYAAAAFSGARRVILAGILSGLAVASRLDMLMVGPMVLWQLWDRPEPKRPWLAACNLIVVSLATFVAAAPWFFTGFIGCLMLVAKIRIMGAGQSQAAKPWAMFCAFAWTNGLAVLMILAGTGFLLGMRQWRFRHWALAAFTAALLLGSLEALDQDPRHHIGFVIVLLTTAIIFLKPLLSAPRVAVVAVLTALALPMAQCARLVWYDRHAYVTDKATEWVEQNVPAGTIVYLQMPWACRPPLPTSDSSMAIWNSESSLDLWRRKFERGGKLYDARQSLPRALSQDVIQIEEAFARRWFILGGGQTKRPRYDIRIYNSSPDSFINDLGPEFLRTGGAVIWRGYPDSPVPKDLGQPVAQWLNARGQGTRVYYHTPAATQPATVPPAS